MKAETIVNAQSPRQKSRDYGPTHDVLHVTLLSWTWAGSMILCCELHGNTVNLYPPCFWTFISRSRFEVSDLPSRTMHMPPLSLRSLRRVPLCQLQKRNYHDTLYVVTKLDVKIVKFKQFWNILNVFKFIFQNMISRKMIFPKITLPAFKFQKRFYYFNKVMKTDTIFLYLFEILKINMPSTGTEDGKIGILYNKREGYDVLSLINLMCTWQPTCKWVLS